MVVTLGEDKGTTQRSGIEVVTLAEHFRIADILGFPSLGTRRRLSRWLRARGIDVMSVHTRFFPMSYVGYRAASAVGIPVIHTEHGSGHVASDSLIIRYASRLVDFTVGRAVLRGANTVLGVSEEVCSFVKRLAGVDAQLFYNAIDISDGAAQSPEFSRPQSLVFVGRLVPGKGWEAFLEVVHRLRDSGRAVRGEVIGDGVDREALRVRVQELGLEDYVTIHGRVSQAEVRKIIRGATLVNPTLLSEGFQTTLIEAIAEGGRVVTYPVPGAGRLRDEGAPVRIAAGRNADGLLSELIQLIDAPPPAAVPELIREWGWPRRAQQYVAVIEQAVSGSSGD